MESNLTQGIIDFSTRMLDEPNLNLTVHLKEGELEQLLQELLEPHLEHHKVREVKRDLSKINIYLQKK